MESMVDALRSRASDLPDSIALGRVDPTSGSVRDSLSFSQLFARAEQAATNLEGATQIGDRVLIEVAEPLPAIVAFFACLRAGVVAVMLPPFGESAGGRRRGRARLSSVVRDCDPSVAVLTSATDSVELDVRCLRFPELLDAAGDGPTRRPPSSGDLAMLQYTSGSTSEPRGVRLRHGALIANQIAIQQAYGHGSETVFASWLPLFHDMGLIGSVLQPVYLGGPTYLLRPEEFVRSPVTWLRAISQQHATTSGGPNFSYALATSRVTDAQLDGVDLTSWRIAFNGAEVVRRSTLAQFGDRFERWGFDPAAFRPSYGLAEATLFVSGARPRIVEDDARGAAAVESQDIAPSGVPSTTLDVRVMEPSGQPAPDGSRGEVWVAGPSVADGYWGRDDDRFVGRYDGAVYLRTGDTGVIMPDGQLLILGRMDDVLSSRGRLVHPEDIEVFLAAEAPEGVFGAFACVRSPSDPDCVAIVAEVHHLASMSARIQDLRRRVAEQFGLVVAEFLPLTGAQLPRTTSGKVQRRACAHLLRRSSIDEQQWREPPIEATSRTDVLDLVHSCISERLGDSSIASEASLIESGLDSFGATVLVQELRSLAGLDVDVSDVLGAASLESLVDTLTARLGMGRPATAGDLPDAPVIAYQDALAALVDQHSTRWHLSCVMEVPAHIETAAIQAALDTVMARHPILRCRIRMSDGKPRVERLEGTSPWREAQAGDLDEAIRAFDAEPLRVTEGEMVRVAVHDLRPGLARRLHVVVHHVAVDEVSFLALLDELWDEVDAIETLPRTSSRQSPTPEIGSEPSTAWPDRGRLPAPPVHSTSTRPGRVRSIATGVPLADLRRAANGSGTTVGAALLAAYGHALATIAGPRGVTVACAVRSEHGGRELGSRVRLVPVAFDMAVGDGDGRDLARRVQGRLLAQRSDDTVAPPPARGRYGFSFSVGDHGGGGTSRGRRCVRRLGRHFINLRWGPTPFEPVADLLLRATDERADLLDVSLEYDADRVDAATLNRLEALMRRFLERLVGLGDAGSPSRLGPERAMVDGETRPTPGDHLALLMGGVEHFVEHVVVVDGQGRLSGLDLLDRVDRATGWLRTNGVRPGDRVAVDAQASLSLVVLQLAIWSVGGVYCPIDTVYAEPRRQRMLDALAPALHIKDHQAAMEHAPAGRSQRAVWTADQPAYILFTSGSTGTPKGVVVSAGGLANTIAGMSVFAVGPGSSVLQVATPGFDASIFEMALAVAHGAELLVAGPNERSGGALAALLRRDTHVVLTPTQLATLPRDARPRTIISAGEDLPEALAARWSGRTRLFNAYGPTEASIWAMVDRVEPGRQVSLGVPIPGVRLAVVDLEGTVCGVGEPGELYLAGRGLAIGYLDPSEPGLRRQLPGLRGSWYATGDRVVMRSDGLVHFLGRGDTQVKVHGVRIELGEIAAAARSHPGVLDAAAVCLPNLVERVDIGVVVAVGGIDVDRRLVMQTVLDAVHPAARPSKVRLVDQLPLTSHGKVDDQRVVEMLSDAPLRVEGESSQQSPDSPFLAVVLEACQREFGSAVEFDTDLHECGLQSVSALMLAQDLAEVTRRSLHPVELMRSATVAQIAEALERSHALPPDVRLSPLTPLQSDIMLHQALHDGDGLYAIPLVFDVHGPLSIDDLVRAVARTVQQAPMLRAAVTADGRRIVRPVAFPDVIHRDASSGPTIGDLVKQACRKVTSAPLHGTPVLAVVRQDDDRHHIALVFHHLFVDGVGATKALEAVQRALVDTGSVGESSPEPVQEQVWGTVADSAASLQRRVEPWLSMFEFLRERGGQLFRAGGVPGPEGLRITSATIGRRDVVDEKRDADSTQKVSLFDLVAACFAAVVSRHLGTADVAMSVVDADRGEGTGAIDCRVRVLPVPFRWRSGAEGFAHSVAEFARLRAEVTSKPPVSLSELSGALQLTTDRPWSPLAAAMVVQQSSRFGRLQVPGLEIVRRRHDNARPRAGLLLEVLEENDELQFRLEADAAVFTHAHAERIMSSITQLLRGQGHEDAGLSTADRLAHEALDRTGSAPLTRSSAPDALSRQVLERPNDLAVIDEHRRVTYGELDERVGALAATLQHRGVGPGEPVAVHLETSVELVVVVHALWRLRGVYVPLGTATPAERAAHIEAALGVRFRVTAGEDPSGVDITRLPGDAARQLGSEHDAAGRSMYVMHTSGSTGRPKAVEVGAKAMQNRLAWMQDLVGLQPGMRVALKTVPTFDVSIWELAWPLFHGATLVVVDAGSARDPRALVDVLASFGVDVAHFVPSMLEAALATITTDSASYRLKHLIASGEELDSRVAAMAQQRVAHKVYNLYGPTEAAIDSTWHEFDADRDTSHVPIGQPLPGMAVDVVDVAGRRVPVGIGGALNLRGVGLAVGYVGEPERTRASFVSSTLAAPAQRAYLTGDRGWIDDAGRVVFGGREDEEVKLAGVRIDPGEVEHHLTSWPGIDAAVVVPLGTGLGRSLGAVVVSTHGVDAARLRAHLRTLLPSVAVPNRFAFVPELPLRSNGKVDSERAQQILLASAQAAAGTGSISSTNVDPGHRVVPGKAGLTSTIRRGWEVTLGHNDFGPDDSFFDVGGSSASLIHLQLVLEDSLGSSVPAVLLLEGGTIRGQAEALASRAEETASDPTGALDVESPSSSRFDRLSRLRKRP